MKGQGTYLEFMVFYIRITDPRRTFFEQNPTKFTGATFEEVNKTTDRRLLAKVPGSSNYQREGPLRSFHDHSDLQNDPI